MKRVAIIIFSILLSLISFAQQEYEEVVYLKNGSVIKGTIIEQIPNESIKIQTKDGNIFVFKMEEVEKITKESTKPTQPVEEAENVVSPGTHKHEPGFFIRLTTGFGYSKLTEDIAGEDFIESSGFSGAGRFQIGGAVSENFILFGEVGAIVQADPSMEIMGEEVDASDIQVTITDFGAGVSYYIMPENIYFALSLFASQVSIEYKGNEGESETGFGFNAMVGKEWWVGNDWGLGIAGFGYYSTMDDKEFLGVTPSISNVAFGLLFTVTYN